MYLRISGTPGYSRSEKHPEQTQIWGVPGNISGSTKVSTDRLGREVVDAMNLARMRLHIVAGSTEMMYLHLLGETSPIEMPLRHTF